MKRRFLTRLKAIVEFDRTVLRDTWDLSSACRELLLEWVDRREREIAVAKAAEFSGVVPEGTVTASSTTKPSSIKPPSSAQNRSSNHRRAAN
jgi:hypothetical protein